MIHLLLLLLLVVVLLLLQAHYIFVSQHASTT